MKLFVPFDISKSNDEERIVSGYASTETLDSQGEIVTRKAMEQALPDWIKFGNIREMHQPSAVGVAVKAHYDEKGLLLEAHVVDDNAWKKVKAGVYKGFSIGGRIKSRDKANKAIITGMDLTEISLVDRPANPEALFDVWKAEGVAPAEEVAASPAVDEPVTKGMMAVQLLASVVDQVSCLATKSKIEEAKEGDTDSVVPGQLQDVLMQLTQVLNDMVEEETAEINDGTALPQDGMFMFAEGAGDLQKQKYTDAERKDMVASGDAMEDGSFPIKNRSDLQNAIRGMGRAKDKAGARTHIERRAKELGAMDLIPDGWADKADGAVDLEKTGRRNSADDQMKLNDAHDAIVAAGAQCDAMKHAAPSDLTKANADLVNDLAKAQTSLAAVEQSLATITALRDEMTATLGDLTKTHAAITTERDDLTKRYETLAAEKTAVDDEIVLLKKELDDLKAQPAPMKGKVLSVAKGDDVSKPEASPHLAVAAESNAPAQWFSGRPN